MVQTQVYLFKDDPHRRWKSAGTDCREREFLHAVQGEAGAERLEFHLMQSEARPFDLTGQTVTFYLTKPDGEKIFLPADVPAETAVQGIAAVTLTAQSTAAPGIAKHGEVRVTAGDGSVLKFPTPNLFISASDTEGAIESTGEFQALDLALNQAGEALASASAANAAAQEALNADRAAVSDAARNAQAAGEAASAASTAAQTASQNAQSADSAAQRANTAAASCETIAGNINGAVTSQINAQKGTAGGVAALDGSGKVPNAQLPPYVPAGRTVAGLPLSSDLTLAQLTAAGLASGDGGGNAQNAMRLGGTEAADYTLKDYGHDFNSDNGYVKLPNGLMLEWMHVVTPSIAAYGGYDTQITPSHIATVLKSTGSITPRAAWDFNGTSALYSDTATAVHCVLITGATAQIYDLHIIAIGI